MNANSPIGILDSGVGGYTVARAVQRLLPHEDVIYYGDGCNAPYGNRTGEDIVHLVRQILDFMASKGVKCAALACSTISTLIDEFAGDYPFPIFSIVQAGSDEVVRRGLKQVGVLSTVFTAKTGCYSRLIRKSAPEIEVYSQGSVRLAALIESGKAADEQVAEELRASLGVLAAAHPALDALMLGCTHYPIVQHLIQREYPQFTTVIDPAEGQARQIGDCLARNGALNEAGGRLQVYTSGDCAQYEALAERLGIRISGKAQYLHVATPL